MLNALYQYAERRQLTLPPGFINKTVKAYISLAADGTFYGITMGGGEDIPCPDMGSLANGTKKCNVIVEKRSVVLPEKSSAKSQFFLDALRSFAEHEPVIGICADVLEDAEKCEQIKNALNASGIKAADRISFQIDGTAIVCSQKLPVWWQEFRAQFLSAGEEQSVCLITGQKTVPVKTTTSITGLRVVGGHASGDALICFDKNAFCSYGLTKAANAPVSEQAYAGVKAALDALLKDAPILSGMKFVHWFSHELEPEEDVFFSDDFFPPRQDAEEEDEPEEELSAEELKTIDAQKRNAANKLVNSVESGETITSTADTVYYILMLSGVGGRIMVRRYEQGNYAELRQQLAQWQQDLELVNSNGTANLPSCKLSARLVKLLKYQKNDRKTFERMGKELSGITPDIITSILTGGRLPEAAAARALAYIRSNMLDEDNNSGIPDHRACQWLKVWLIRNKEDKQLGSAYNFAHTETAYHCGGMMAVFSAAQKVAMGDLNASMAQRFYASAIQTPALVIGRLSQMSTHYFDKLKAPKYYAEKLEQLSDAIDGSIPATLTLEQQSYFALGYYQMNSLMRKEYKEYLENKAAKAAHTQLDTEENK